MSSQARRRLRRRGLNSCPHHPARRLSGVGNPAPGNGAGGVGYGSGAAGHGDRTVALSGYLLTGNGADTMAAASGSRDTGAKAND